MKVEELAEKYAGVFRNIVNEKDNGSSNSTIRIITHLDTDGLASAAIIIRALKKIDQKIWLTTVKQLEDPLLAKLLDETKKQKFKAIFFLDFGSAKLTELRKFSEFTNTFVIDHHEINIEELNGNENETERFYFFNQKLVASDLGLTASCLTYFFVKAFDKTNEDLSQLAILGVIGDRSDKNITKEINSIIEDSKKHGSQIRKGLVIFSATRPIHKALELSSNVYIPGVTGSYSGSVAFLREASIDYKEKGKYRTMFDLKEEELSRLITAIVLRRMVDGKDQDVLGTIYLLKLFNRLYDARELSTMINACGRLNYSSLAIAFLIGIKRAKDKIEEVYAKYKNAIVTSLNAINKIEKKQGENYIIFNAGKSIRDTIIGTVISIISSSFIYPKDMVLIGMAQRSDGKIKVSARVVAEASRDENSNGNNGNRNGNGNGEEGPNLYELLDSVVKDTGGEVGGHKNAAGCLISKKKEALFLELLEKKLEIQKIVVA